MMACLLKFIFTVIPILGLIMHVTGASFQSGDVTLVAVNSTTLSLSWIEPPSNSDITGYRFRCKTGSGSYSGVQAIILSADARTISIGPYGPYQPITCRVRVQNGAGVEDWTDVGPVRTTCAAPSSPTLNDVTQTANGLRSNAKVELIMSWQSSTANCASVTYNVELKNTRTGYEVTNQQDSPDHQLTQTVYPHQPFLLSVTAVNNDDMRSSVATKNFWSQEAAPVFGNAVATLMAVSWSSLSLSWSSPQHEFGNITGYKHRCKSQTSSYQSWNNLASLPSRSVSVGGFNPNDLVTCQIQVANSAGTDQIERSSRTLCDKPTRPTFSLSEDVDGGYRLISVSEIQTNHSCESLKQIIVKLYEGESSTPKDTRTLTSLTDVIFGRLDALTLYKVMITAENNQNMVSEIGIRNVTTGILVIQPVRQLRIQANGPYCVELSWLAPSDQPNSLISNYNYQCNDLELERTTGLAAGQCGFAPYQLVSCWVQTITTQTEGTITYSDAIYTDCTDPGPTSFTLEELEMVGEDVSIAVLNIQVVLNCESLSNLIIRTVEGDTTQSELLQNSTADQLISGLRPFTSYRVEIEAINNALKISDISSQHIVTREQIPSDGPRNLEVFINSTCIRLSWLQPARPNGDIKLYRGNCSYDKYSWLVISNKPRFTTCRFPPPKSLISCSLRAENLAGESPIVHLFNITSKTEGYGSPTASSTGESAFLYGLFGLIPVTIIIAVVAVCLRRRRRRQDNERGVTESTARHTYEGLNLSSLSGTGESSTNHIYDQPFSNRQSVANDTYELPDVGQDSHARQENESQQWNESQQQVDFYENMTSDLSGR